MQSVHNTLPLPHLPHHTLPLFQNGGRQSFTNFSNDNGYLVWFLYGLFTELLVSTGLHSWFTWYKQLKEAICCFPASYSSGSWVCFYIQAHSHIYLVFHWKVESSVNCVFFKYLFFELQLQDNCLLEACLTGSCPLPYCAKLVSLEILICHTIQ